jgi:hypothetical protein
VLEVRARGQTLLEMRAQPSIQLRVLGLAGAVEAGIGAWYFTSGKWAGGIFYVLAVGVLAGAYIRKQRQLDGKDGGRRY